MNWTMPETITVGFIVVFAIGLIYKFLGQRTDPKLLELLELQTNAASKRDEDNNKVNERLAEALDRNTNTLDTVKSGVEMSFNAFAKSIQQMVSSITLEHQTQLVAIGNVPATIMPTMEIITQQLEDHKGSVQQMNEIVDDQSGTIQQILAAVLRLESQIGIFQSENKRLGDEIEKAQAELITIKTDVANLKPIGKSEAEIETDEAPKIIKPESTTDKKEVS